MQKGLGRDGQREGINDLAEDTLAALGEQRVFSKERAEVVRLISGLQDAGRLDVELAANRVRKAEAELRESKEALARVEETNGHEAEALLRLVQLSANGDRALDEDLRQVSVDVKKLGATYTREELIANGAPGLLERRRRRVHEAGATKSEAEAI